MICKDIKDAKHLETKTEKENEHFLTLKSKDMNIKKVTFEDCLKFQPKIKNALERLKDL
jgi:hypothetical protein